MRIRKSRPNNIVYRSVYGEQRLYDIAKCVLKNKDKTYDELMNLLKPYSVSGKSYLINSIEALKEYSLRCGTLIEIIMKHKYNLKHNIIDKDLEKQYNRIGEYKENKADVYVREYNKINIPLKAKDSDRDKNIELSEEFADLLMNGYTLEEVGKKYSLNPGTVGNYLLRYLVKSPEKFVQYNIYKNNVNVIELRELNEIKEVLGFFIVNLDKSLEDCKKLDMPKVEINRRLVYLKKIRTQYEKALQLLNDEKWYTACDLKNIEETFIKDMCVDYINSKKCEKKLKTDNVYKDTQDKIYEIYKKKIYK